MSQEPKSNTLSLNKKSDPQSAPQDADRPKRASVRNHKSNKRDRTKVPEQYRAKKPVEKPSTTAKPTEESKPRQKEAGTDTRSQPKHRRRDSITDQKRQPRTSLRQPPTRGGKLRDGYDPDRAKPSNPQNSAPASTDKNKPRLSKVMADRGICSRREADVWIQNGWVKADGEIIEVLGTRVDPNVELTISSYAHEVQAESVTFLLHKPVGYVSGQPEDGYEPAMALINAENEWTEETNLPPHLRKAFRNYFLKGLAPAGRLDIDSTGLLVLTQDGRVARQLIGEHSSVEKEYLVRVEGDIIPDGLKLLNFGLSLDDKPLKRAKVSWQNEEQLRFVLKEGKKRQIRRMCELVGLNVVGLKRVRIGQVKLSKLPVGQWRYLGPNERF